MSWMSFGCVALVYLVVLLLSQIRQAKAAATVAAPNNTNHHYKRTNGATNNNHNNNKMECSNISSRQTSTPPQSHLLITMGATSPVASCGGASTPGAAAAPSSSASTTSTAVATTTTSSSSSTTSVPASSTTQTVPGPSAAISSTDNSNVINNSNTNNNNSGSGNSVLSGAAMPTQSGLQLNTLLPIDFGGGNKTEDANNSSLASAMSEGQRSLSGAPSASSSPILSPPGKIFGRNANGTLIATSRPSNEAEIQLYRVLQRASLLAYYDTLLEMGGDDVQQLYEAGEEEFLEIMALVGMASKPLHVRRLQKALHEWANNPALFQGGPLASAAAASQGLCDTPTKVPSVAGGSSLFGPADSTPAALRYKFSPFTPTPLLSTAQATPHSAHLLSQMCSPSLQLAAGLATTAPSLTAAAAATVAPVPQTSQLPSVLSGGGGPSGGAANPLVTAPLVTHPHATHPAQHLPPAQQQSQAQQQQQQQAPPSLHSVVGSAAVSSVLAASLSSVTSHQVTSSSPQLTPVLTEMQIARITLGAEKIARHLPQREPRPQTSKKRTTRELEQVMNMSESDPRRMDEIRKYSAIYGRFDCKRRPEKPLTLHEVCVNEAAAQLCRLVPALLTRRDELFPLARQIVKDAGFGHSASIARYGGLLQQMQQTQAATNAAAVTAAAALSAASSLATVSGASMQHSAASLVDCESSDSTTAMPALKRQRLLSMSQDSNNSTTTTTTTGATHPSGVGAPNAATDISRDPAEDARFNLFAMYQKFAKPPFDIADVTKFSLGRTDFEDNDNDSRLSSFSNSSSPLSLPANGSESERRDHDFCAEHHQVGSSDAQGASHQSSPPPPPRREDTVTGVQVISAAGGHIIAVANPALALSPTLHEALNMKREARSPDL